MWSALYLVELECGFRLPLHNLVQTECMMSPSVLAAATLSMAGDSAQCVVSTNTISSATLMIR